MANANDTTSAAVRDHNGSLIELSNRIHEIAAQLAGIKPIAEILCDKSSPDVGNSINLIGAVSGYINHALCEIAEQVRTLADEGGVA